MKKRLAVVLMVFLAFAAVSASTLKDPQPAPKLTIDLATLGYKSPIYREHSDREVFRDLTITMQDEFPYVAFISENVAAVYFTRLEREAEAADSAYRLEVFFVDINSGKLVAHRTWKALRKQWWGDGYDSEGTIIAVRGGFLVQADATLELYSPDLQLVKSLDLRASTAKDSAMWSVKVAPGGHVIQVQPGPSVTQVHRGAISSFGGGDSGASIWLKSDTLEKIGTQIYYPGARTVSENSIVLQRVHCIDIERSGEPSRHLYCPEDQSLEFPVFLKNDEVVCSYHTGFVVLSAQGAEIWKAGEPDPGDPKRKLQVGSPVASMDGSRFGVYLTPYKGHSEFDGIRLRGGYLSIFVFDEHSRQRIFIAAGDDNLMGSYALSPQGATLAVIIGKSVAIYQLPSA
jgi:hypothetical protein